MTASKFNEITYAIGQLQSIVGYSSNAHERVFSRYPAEIVAAYKAACAKMDQADADASDSEWTY